MQVLAHFQEKTSNCFALSVYLNRFVLESISSYRYLGVLISYALSWCSLIHDLSLKVRKQVGLLYHRFSKHASPAALRHLYMALVHLHFSYEVPIWDPHPCKGIDVL